MKKIISILILLSFTIKAQDVKIGTQTWMSKNLDESKFRNGEAIPQAKTNLEWELAGRNKQPAWCYYENKEEKGTTYGKLYNWYAVNDPRGLAPNGYHIPTYEEWSSLTMYLGNTLYVGINAGMKSKTGWENDGNGTNESGFAGLPGGFRNEIGDFEDIGSYGEWWTSSENDTRRAWSRNMTFSDVWQAPSTGGIKRAGISVRCLRD